MHDHKPRILQVTAGTTHGGASKIAVNLYEQLLAHNIHTQLATGGPVPDGKPFLKIPKNNFVHPRSLWEKGLFYAGKKIKPYIGNIKGAGRLSNALYNLARPSCLLKTIRGVDNFERYPGTQEFFHTLIPLPDIIHCHNLHGKYFDLRILPALSHATNVVLTLHDEWLFTGHCACTFGCERWKTGCGQCPNLKTYEPLWRDTTAYNLKQKSNIYKTSKLHIITPSQWLMDKVQQSILQPAIETSHVIHNGVDTHVFKPSSRNKARQALNLPEDSYILLFAANRIKQSPTKDYPTLEKAVLSLKSDIPVQLICLGETNETIHNDNITITFLPYITEDTTLVQYYQAADIFIHATKTDNFPATILEAMACGLPVIGTNIGGIPEQICTHTGILYEKGNDQELATLIQELLSNKQRRTTMSQNAAKKVIDQFSIHAHTQKHIMCYQTLKEPKGEM